MPSIAARELRNNTAAILRRVEAGEEFEVSRDNRPVALIVPLHGRSPWLPAADIIWGLERLGPDATGLAALLSDIARDSTDDLDLPR